MRLPKSILYSKMLTQASRVNIAMFLNYTCMAILVAMMLIGGFFRSFPNQIYWLAGIFLAAMGVLTYALHKKVRGSIQAILVITILLTGLVIFTMGSVKVPITSIFLVLIIISAILLGGSGILISTTLASLVVLYLVILEINHTITPIEPVMSYFQYLGHLLVLFFTAFVSQFIIRQIEGSHAELRKLTKVVEQTPTAIVITNLLGEIEYVNSGFTTMTGYLPADVVGKNPRILSSHNKTKEEYKEIWDSILAGKEWRGEFTNIRKDGTVYYDSSLITPILDDHKKITQFVALKEDITKRKLAEEALLEVNRTLAAKIEEIEELHNELRSQALHDPLTGLYNRRYLNEMLEKEFLRAERAKSDLSVIVIDIDLFKNVNDTYGHRTGDTVLVAIAKYLESSVRATDFCCRYGGEEFVLVMPTASVDIAVARAESMRDTLQSLHFNEGDKQIRITASFGIATYPLHARSIEDLLSRADQALYRSKHSGRNQVNAW